MATIVTPATLVADIRVMSGLRNNQLFSDDQILELVVDAGEELYDDVEGTFEHYFDTPFDFTIAAGTNAVALPDGFKRDNSLTFGPLSSSPETVDALGSWLERDQMASSWAPRKRKYFLAGNQLQVFPPSSAPGDYRLFYTPQFRYLWSVPADFTVTYATTGILSVTGSGIGPGKTLTATVNGSFVVDGASPPVATRVLVKDQTGFATSNGIYVLTNTGSVSSPYILTRATDFDTAAATEVRSGVSVKATAGTVNAGAYFALGTFSGAVDVGVQNYAPLALPPAVLPWVLYLKVHSSITIRTSRQQDSADLQTKLAALKTRVAKSAKNRTEAPRQAPITRHGRRGYGCA